MPFSIFSNSSDPVTDGARSERGADFPKPWGPILTHGGDGQDHASDDDPDL